MENKTNITAQTTDISITTGEAVKEVGGFLAKLGATLAGGIVGITKASAVTVREVKMDPDSYLGMVATQSVKANYNRAQNTTYNLLKDSDSKTKEATGFDL